MDDTQFSQNLKDSLNKLSKEIDRAMRNVLSKEEEIREHCASLRNQVDTQSEEMIEEIRQWNEKTRNKINKYEKERLDKFNAEEFEASASILKSLISDVTEHQNKIKQHIEEASSDQQRTNELCEQTLKMTRKLERQNMIVTNRKFSYLMLDLTENGFHKSCLATLNRHRTNGLEKLEHLIMIDNRPTRADVFINPFDHSDELILIVPDWSSKTSFKKINSAGRELFKKDIGLMLYYVAGVQTLKDYFIIQYNEDFKFLRFDYDFNQMEMSSKFSYSDIREGFAANQRSIFSIHHVNEKYLIRCSSHDLTHSEYLPFTGKFVSGLLATDKYLYVWYDGRVQIIDIEYHEGRCTPRVILNKRFSTHCSIHVKKLDEQIAIYYQGEGIVRLYTADTNLKLVNELKIDDIDENKIGKLVMSADCSADFCFYDRDGFIYHSIC